MSYYESLGKAAVTEATISFLDVTRDPYLSEFACEVNRLSNLTTYGRPGKPCPRTRGHHDPRVGVGLRDIVVPLRLWTRHKQYPFVAPLAIAGVLGLAYAMGRNSR